MKAWGVSPDWVDPRTVVRIHATGYLTHSAIPYTMTCMRTTLHLPVALLDEARTALGFKSKTDTVVYALREVVRRSRVDELKNLIGRVQFEFDPTDLRKKDRRRA